MPKSSNLSTQINNRLFMTVMAAWLMIAALVAVGLIGFYRTDQAYSSALRQEEALQMSALNFNTSIMTEMLNTRAFLISGEESAATRRRLAHLDADRESETLKMLLSDAPGISAPTVNAILSLHAEYDSVAERLIELRKAGKTAEALQLFDAQSDPLVLAIQASSHNLQNEIRQGTVSLNQDYSDQTRRDIWLVAAFFLGSMALSGIVLIRWVSPLLNTLGYFETTLINASQTQVYQPVASQPPGSARAPALIDAYNRMVQRLLESNTAILKYISYLHHEMNTLLGSVLGYGQMLADPELRPHDASMEEYGQIIVQQTRRTVNLVEDFTLAARIEGSQFAPVLLPVNLSPLLAAVVEDAQEDAQRDIALGGCQSAVLVLADALSLENALRKVINNALRFSPAGTPVEVTVEVCPSPRSVQIHVRDEGVGIAAGDLHLLFRPFSRLKNELNRQAPGSGLGLYLAGAILRAHRGHITVASQVGKGSIFTIHLPLEDRQMPPGDR